jgi:hypothetical protein
VASVAGSGALVDPLEEVSGRYVQRYAELGDRAYAWLPLGALDLRDVGHVEIGSVRETFLA